MKGRIHCQKADVDVYVTKPIGYTELVNSIRNSGMKYSSQENAIDPRIVLGNPGSLSDAARWGREAF